jgi:cytoskeletal protein RodZ
LCDLEDFAVGITFILGLVIYVVIIFGLTLWFFKFHSLKCQRMAGDKNVTETPQNESQTTSRKPGNSKN